MSPHETRILSLTTEQAYTALCIIDEREPDLVARVLEHVDRLVQILEQMRGATSKKGQMARER